MEKKKNNIKNRRVRTNPIEDHYTDCLKCDYVHNVEALMKYYKRQGAHSMHYLCDACNHRMRLTITKLGYLVFHKQSVDNYKKKQWDDVFDTATIEISQDVKTWLMRSYQPPRKREVKQDS